MSDVPPPVPESTRREVRYFGQVQGVGFRYTTRNIAARFDVTGYVMNSPDGSVLLVVEGRSDEVDRFLDAVQLELKRNIDSIQSQRLAAKAEFADFSVRH